jgi:hypothetical protein
MIVATENPDLARSSLSGMPAGAREGWIAGAANGLARNDFEGTLRWLDGFRGEPGYDRAVNAALSTGAASNPVAVARYLDSAPASAASPQIVGNVTRRWVATDAAAAERWARALPSGPVRDEALSGLMQSGDAATISRVLGELSSDAARARGAMTGAATLARTDLAAARRLIAEHIRDPEQRALAERQIEIMASQPRGATVINTGGGIVVLSPGGSTSTCGFTDPASGAVLPC